MGKQGGFGLAIQIDVSGVPTAFAQVEDVDIPQFMNFMAEVTTHDSTQGYYEAVTTGKKRVEQFPIILVFDSTIATHAEIISRFDDGTASTFSVADPDGNETIAVEVFVELIKRSSPQEDAVKATVTLHPTGAPTIT